MSLTGQSDVASGCDGNSVWHGVLGSAQQLMAVKEKALRIPGNGSVVFLDSTVW
jgi:hypothetical protein